MKTNIIVRLEVEGFHFWPEAREVLPEVGFLSDRHRHMFHITAKKAVDHSNRDIELIVFKRQLTEYLDEAYGSPCEFGSMSCEMIAEKLVKLFNLEHCEVSEDGENGAEVFVEGEYEISTANELQSAMKVGGRGNTINPGIKLFMELVFAAHADTGVAINQEELYKKALKMFPNLTLDDFDNDLHNPLRNQITGYRTESATRKADPDRNFVKVWTIK